jgi:squalene synthase HpnC
LADEGPSGLPALYWLSWWRQLLHRCYAGQCQHPVFVALQPILHRYAIPPQPFEDLLLAFEQDQRYSRYATFTELLNYCRHSANPVGHLVLYLFNCYDAYRAALADQICTGLQLANFWQDVARDWDRQRVYIPQEDCCRFGYSEADFIARRCNPSFRQLLRFQVERTHLFFDQGEQLLPLLPPAAQTPVSLFLLGGRAILRAIEKQDYDVWRHRPKVSAQHKRALLLRVVGQRLKTELRRLWSG